MVILLFFIFRIYRNIKIVKILKIWIEFDKNGSGYIEIDELKEFISKLLTKNPNTSIQITDEKLEEYSESIVGNDYYTLYINISITLIKLVNFCLIFN